MDRIEYVKSIVYAPKYMNIEHMNYHLDRIKNNIYNNYSSIHILFHVILFSKNEYKYVKDYKECLKYIIKKEYKRDVENYSLEKLLLFLAKKNDANALHNLGGYYYSKKDYNNMKRYYSLAIEKKYYMSYNNLAKYYEEKKNYNKMEKYYLKGAENKIVFSMYNLGLYYQENKDYENMKKYYLMAIENNNTLAMIGLGEYYEENKDYKNAEKYYKMAIENKDMRGVAKLMLVYSNKIDEVNTDKIKNIHDEAYDRGIIDIIYLRLCFNLENADYKKIQEDMELGLIKGCQRVIDMAILHYCRNGDFEQVIKYCSKAAKEYDNFYAIKILCIYYMSRNDIENMIKYYLIGVEKGDINSMNGLGNYYYNNKNYKDAEKYYLLAMQRGCNESVEKLINICKDNNKVITRNIFNSVIDCLDSIEENKIQEGIKMINNLLDKFNKDSYYEQLYSKINDKLKYKTIIKNNNKIKRINKRIYDKNIGIIINKYLFIE